jgi:hypothetical protein
MSNDFELFKSFSVLIFSFASFCLGFLLSLCLNRPKKDRYTGHSQTYASPVLSNDWSLREIARLDLERGPPTSQVSFKFDVQFVELI